MSDNVLVDNTNFQNFQEFNKEKGFKCVNEEQPRGTVCADYKIRLKCPRELNTHCLIFTPFEIRFCCNRSHRQMMIQVSISKLACRHILGSPRGPFSSALALSLPDRKGAMISGMGGRVIEMVEFFCPP